MADIALVANNVPNASKVRMGYIVKDSMALGGDAYRTGGILLDPIAKKPFIVTIIAYGGPYVWVFDPSTNKLKAMKADDKIDTAGDGKLIEETDSTAMNFTLYYTAIVFPDNGPNEMTIMYLEDIFDL